MVNLLRRLWLEEEGQDLVEYALLVVLIALGAVISMKSLAYALYVRFSTLGCVLTGKSYWSQAAGCF